MSHYPQVKQEFYDQIKKHALLAKDQESIFEAFSYGEFQHRHEKRKDSDEPYFIHCTGVALSLLSEPDVEKEFVIAALLHDTVEDTDTTIELLEQKYGSKVATVVKALTKLPSSYKKEMGAERYYQEAFFGPINETSKTYPFIWKIKLADRRNNLQTYWKTASQAKKDEYVWETHEILRYTESTETPLRSQILDLLEKHYS